MVNQDWEQLRAGKHSALKKLYDEHANALYQYGCQMTKRSDLVQDSMQDVFIYIWQKRSQLNPVNNVRAYLITSFKRELFRKLKAEKKERDLSLDGLPFELDIADQPAEENLLDRIDPSRLKQAILDLSPRQREILFLRFESGLEYQEIATHLDMKYQSVRNLLHRAVKKLRENIDSLSYLVFFLLKCVQ